MLETITSWVCGILMTLFGLAVAINGLVAAHPYLLDRIFGGVLLIHVRCPEEDHASCQECWPHGRWAHAVRRGDRIALYGDLDSDTPSFIRPHYWIDRLHLPTDDHARTVTCPTQRGPVVLNVQACALLRGLVRVSFSEWAGLARITAVEGTP
jgi:hypothetical protein